MSRKLLTFLGTNKYEPCHYVIDGQPLTVTRFVQTSLLEYYGRDWNESDRVIVFLTKAAREKNWQDGIDSEGQPLEGLASSFHRIVPHVRVETVNISDGQSEREYWQLFDQIMDCIEVGDEVYFDITHGFRSIPMMALIILNYARVLKQAQLGKLLYGCFEALGPVHQVRDLAMNERLAPVIDLTDMMTLFNWTQGVDNFLRSGDASLIKELTLTETNPVLSETKGQDAAAKELNNLAKQLDKFTQSMATVRGSTLGEEIDKLKRNLAESRKIEDGRVQPLEQLLERLEEKIDRYSGEPIMDLYEAACWCRDHGLIQQGYTFLYENLITSVCHVLKVPPEDKGIREMVSMAFHLVTNPSLTEQEMTDVELAHIKRQSVSLLWDYRDRLSVFGTLNEYRNNINHAGMNKDSKIKAEKFRSQLDDLLSKLKPFFEAMQERINTSAGSGR